MNKKLVKFLNKLSTIFIICILLVFISSNGTATRQDDKVTDNKISLQQQGDWWLAVIGIIVGVVGIVIAVWPKDKPVAEAVVQITVDGNTRNPVENKAYDPARIAQARDSAIGVLGSQVVADLTVINPVGYECTVNTDNSYGTPAKHGTAAAVFTARCNGEIKAVPPIRAQADANTSAELTATFFNFSSFNFNMSRTALPGDFFKMDTEFLVENQSIFEWGFTTKIDNYGNLYIIERRGNFSDGDVNINSSSRSITEIRNRTVNFTIPYNQTTNISSNTKFEIGESMAGSPPVDQTIGVYDTLSVNLSEGRCRGCHTSGVPNRHHNIVPTGEWSCLNCHPVIAVNGSQSVLIDRNCMNCHNGTAFYANPTMVNITRPHHNTTNATSRNCKSCHGSYVDNYNDGHYVPSYNTSLVTPSASYKVINLNSGRKWGGCEACHDSDSSVIPQILTNSVTHHDTMYAFSPEYPGYPVNKAGCQWCHAYNETGDLLPHDIRTVWSNGTVSGGCEQCHSVASIHNIQYNYTGTNGQLGYGHIGNNFDCNGCHAWYVAGIDRPFAGAIIPELSAMIPTKLTAGIPTEVTIKGSNFVQDGYSTVVVVDGVSYIPTSITDTQIVVTIPALNTGVYEIKVMKGDTISKLATLTVVTPIDVVTAKLVQGKITITGTGFGPQPDPLFTDLGVFITTKKGDKFKTQIINWTAIQIVVSGTGTNTGDLLAVKSLNGEDSTTVLRR